ncbi:alcohol dehydrogenase catalytic domain-containing protein [Amycolatopsis carbonis]|uniref:alcohol dehydrogenase catalytic domain-containing protein n=1 Tax=Amycolatopsis carbonis TaxID=715471 RepID=UPI003341E21F
MLVEVAAAGVGNWDDVVRVGAWNVGLTAPMALGVEVAGTVVAVGSKSRPCGRAMRSSAIRFRCVTRAAGPSAWSWTPICSCSSLSACRGTRRRRSRCPR